MGLLSDPSLNLHSQFGRRLSRHIRKICLAIYLAGLLWFICLAYPSFNHSTYLSENALSPGLLYAEIRKDTSRLAHVLLEELKRERETHQSTTPHSWIWAKMKQIGLETHYHNFTLKYPFGGEQAFSGKNIYGIMRAPRIASTEGIVFSCPYRPPTSMHGDVSASVALLLAFADFVRKKSYWAKDIIFLITEQEQLGAHAWLEAYHNGFSRYSNSHSNMLESGSLPAHAGALQAAINLEMHDLDVDYVDVKVEGLNGQLPNLDLFNLVQRLAGREDVVSGYKLKLFEKRSRHQVRIRDNLRNMAAMMMSQASGVPNGNHGLFHRYRIESLTLEGIRESANGRVSNRLAVLKMMEGILRSLNNLLERFHQSYFFYILVQNDRFVSIGDFMPPLILVVGTLFVKAFLLWISTNCSKNGATEEEQLDESETSTMPANETEATNAQYNLPYRKPILYVGGALALGLLSHLVSTSSSISYYFVEHGGTTEIVLVTVLSIFALVGFLLPMLCSPIEELELLQMGTLVLLGVVLTAVGLLNFSLGFFIAVISAPLGIFITNCKKHSFTHMTMLGYGVLLNPLVIAYAIVWVLTLDQFPEMTIGEVSLKAISIVMVSFAYARMDFLIYTNWLYPLLTVVLFPIWILVWTLCVSLGRHHGRSPVKEKTN